MSQIRCQTTTQAATDVLISEFDEMKALVATHPDPLRETRSAQWDTPKRTIPVGQCYSKAKAINTQPNNPTL